MQEEQKLFNSSPQQVHDKLSRTTFTLSNGQIKTEREGTKSELWTIPMIQHESRSTHRHYLHFSTPSTTHLSINPWGNLLVSNSERFQEVELSETYTTGSVWWEIFVPHTTLALTIGVKDKKSNQYFNFDFSSKESTRLTFKLNLSDRTFKVWINGIQSESKPSFSLPENANWTPFIRVRQSGTTLALNPFVEDPEKQCFTVNIFNETNNASELRVQEQKIQELSLNLKKDETVQQLQLIDNHLLLIGPQSIRIIPRNKNNGRFELDQWIQFQESGQGKYYTARLREMEYNILKEAAKFLKKNILGNVVSFQGSFWIRKTKDQWLEWSRSICEYLNSQIISNATEIAYQVFEITLSLTTRIFSALGLPEPATRWHQLDRDLINQTYRHNLKSISKLPAPIPSNLSLTNSPALTFAQKVMSVNSFESYIAVQLEDSKISLYSARGTPFRLGDFILSKAIKKDSELTESAKQADQIRGNLGQPTIYKILKNCLKYADKVKPPEKLVKELANRKEKKVEKAKKQEPKEQKDVINKELEGTLIQMGFDVRIVRKALIQCNNASLQAAMDLVLGGTIVVEEQKPLAPIKDWTCQTCTLVNARTTTKCAVCQTPMPPMVEQIEKPEQKEKIEALLEEVEEEVKSDRIEQPLEQVFTFATGVALAPVIVAAVFKSSVRFRLFALNPRFFANCYTKGDLFADLVTNNFYERAGSIPDESIQKIVGYLSPEERREKSVSWMALEDVDLTDKSVKQINFHKFGLEKGVLKFCATLLQDGTSKNIFFSFDTSKIYLEKQRSLIVSPELKEQLENKIQNTVQTNTPTNVQRFNFERSSNKVSEFEVFFSPTERIKLQTDQIDVVNEQKRTTTSLLPLYVVHSPQQGSKYPEISYTSPWSGSYEKKRLWRNGVVLGNFRQKLMQIECMSLELASNNEKINGYLYFANDYELKPMKMYRFTFDGNTKRLSFNFANIRAGYVVVFLEPHLEDRLIELSKVELYGTILDDLSIPNPNEIPITLDSEPSLTIQSSINNEKKGLVPYSCEAFAINLTHDLTVQKHDNIYEKGDVKLLAYVDASHCDFVELTKAELNGFTTLKVNTLFKKTDAKKSNAELDQEYSQIFKDYLSSRDRKLLYKLLSSALDKNQDADLSAFQIYSKYLVALPFNSSNKNDAKAFLRYIMSSLCKQKQTIKLSSLIDEGLRSKNLTANGLEILLWLGNETQSLTASQVNTLFVDVVSKLTNKIKGDNQEYNIFSEKTIFSPSIYHIGSQENYESSLDRISSKIMLKKLRFSRLFTIDLFSCHRIRQLQLNFDRTETHNKLIVKVSWFNQDNVPQGNLNFGYNYSAWNSLCTDKKMQNRVLSIPLRKFDIETRYMQVQVSFTLHPFTACKHQINNLTDNQIFPTLFGSYLRQSGDLPSLQFATEAKHLRFLKKLGAFAKFIVTSKQQQFMYFEEGLEQQEQNLEKLTDTIELKKNHEKWLSVMMRNASQENLNYHYTLFAALAQQLLKKRQISAPSTSLLQGLMTIENKEVGSLLALNEKLLRLIYEKYPETFLQILSNSNNSKSLTQIFRKNNPLNLEDNSKRIIDNLKQKNVKIATNCLHLFNQVCDLSKENHRQIYQLLHQIFLDYNLLQQCITLYERNGWLQGLPVQLIDKVSDQGQSQLLLKRICQSAKKAEDLQLLVSDEIAKQGPTENVLAVLEQLAERVSASPIDGNEVYREALQQREQPFEQNLPSNYIERLLKISRSFELNIDTIALLLQRIFDLKERNILWTQLKNLPLMKQKDISTVIFNYCLNSIGSWINIQKRKRTYNADLFEFVCHLLSFVDGNHPTLSKHAELIDLWSKLLFEQVNWDGQEGCRFITRKQSTFLSIAYYLGKLCSEEQSCGSIDNLVKWCVLNHRSGVQSQTSTTVPGHFFFLQQKALKILFKALSENESYSHTISDILLEYLNNSIYLNRSNRYLGVILRSKVYGFVLALLREIKNQSALQATVKSLLDKQGFFRKILNALATLNGVETEDNEVVKQTQIANSLVLVGDQQPKDWLVYRSGAKNHVFELKYEGKGYHSLLFEREQPYWPSQIVVGFESNSGANGTVLAPREVLIEMGDSKDKLNLVGHLNLVPFESFEGYSVKIFALNLHRLSSKFTPKNSLRSYRILKMTFVSPYEGMVTDGAEGHQISATKYISYINFLSVLAYAKDGPENIPENITNLIGILEQLSDANHIQDMSDLLSDGSNVKFFEESLKGISYLLSSDKYSKVAHKFLLRACQVNASLGESRLNEYFNATNPVLSAKMVGQIVLTSQQHSVKRVIRYYKFLAQKFDKEAKDADILPFVDNFSQIVSTLQRNSRLTNNNTVEVCQISEKNIQFILNKAASQNSFRKLARTILAAETPLSFELQADGKNKDHLWEQLFSSSKGTDRELLASLINASPACLEWFLQKDYLNATFKKIFESLQSTDQNIVDLVDRLTFLTLLCRNFTIKENVTKAQLDLQIFELLVGGNEKGLLAKADSSQLRESLVNFIAVASLGSPNERIIGALLKDSLNTTILEGSSKFVGEVFLPLLNSYSKTVVCLVPYSPEQNKILADLSSLQHFQPNKKIEIRQSEKFKLGTLILNDTQKESLFERVRESTGHKWGIFKLISSHGQLSSNKNLLNFKNSLNKPKQILLLVEAGKRKLGLFYSSKDRIQSSNNLKGNKKSFLFEVDEKEAKILTKGSPNENMASFAKVEDSQVEALRIYYNNKVAIEIRYDGLADSTISVGDSKKIVEEMEAITAVEYWSFDSQSAESFEKVWANENVFTKRLLSQLSDCAFFRSEFKSSNNLGLLRQEPLFEFPSSITVKELLGAVQILGRRTKSDANFEIRLPNGGHVNHSATLESIAKGANGEMILDLLVDLEGVISGLDMSPEHKKIEFLPSKGILKYFEENEGVKSMIIAIKKSISDWSNAVRKEKWMQYINEVEKFSGFPHFFGVYLREKETFNLLLQILSGLPDKQADTKWDEKEVQASQRLLKIVSDILYMENSQQFRAHAIKHDFLIIILGRLKILSGTFARHYEQNIEEEEEANLSSPDKKATDDDGTKKIKKKKGVGYTAETNSNTKWMKEDNMATRKKQFESIEPILMLIEGFLGGSNWKAPHQLLKQIQCSCLLPFIEECLRAGTLLEMSKHPEKYRSVLKVIRAIAKQDNLVPTLLPLSKHYEPAQIESIESLLKSLNNTSKIFLSCLGQNLSEQDKISQQLANDLIATYNIVDEVVIEYAADEEDEGQIQHTLSLPLDKKYRLLMKDLRFDYIDMKETPTKIKHHYSSNFNANYKPSQTKMIRLAQQLADISTALPYEHTNAVYVRCDKDRVDFMQALIMGSNGTPYGHGAYLFDIYFDDNYPNGPPKVNLTTTGHGKIRFNPNLYACGKVCLSLLGTWRGSASQNWDSKVSTLLQVLLSIQAIIMSEEVYFNEPGFEGEQGTEEGEKKNEAYSNIVRYGNIKFAMLENIKNPPKGFESVIRRHFYLKKDEIMDECRKWLKYAEKRAANYVGLVNDHNSSWASEYKKSKTQYKENLEKVVKQLEQELNKLPPPSASDLAHKQNNKRIKKKKQGKDMKDLEKMQHEEIDVSYSNKISEDRELDINDEKVRDRWSRYIGAMGIDAVSRQSKADILVLGLAPFALEVVKNLVLSGCRKLTIVEDGDVDLFDLSGGFFYTQEDLGKKRVDSVMYKIRQLNCYVKVDTISREAVTAETLAKYTLVFATELGFAEQVKYATICREKGVKFVSADCFGAACRITNDYGKFEVLDKNGEEPVEVMIKDIECSERGLVTLLDGAKHSYEDGQAIVINHVEGMKLKEDATKSINGAIRKVKVINFKSFEIGDTRMFEPYVRNGTAKNIKTPVIVDFPPLQKALDPKNPSDLDQQLQFFDFAKQPKSALLRLCFITLDQFRANEKRFPSPWTLADAQIFKTYLQKNSKQQLSAADYKFACQFAFSCRGNLPPLCAFFGGLVSQQIIKGITQKYKPISPSFYLNFMEILPSKEDEKQWTVDQLAEIYKKGNSRDEGLIAVIGKKLVEMASESRIFMVGAGAIGCQLLKNFAMIGLGTGESGKIVVTDPDHIENSNLNRQFLFRQKHISKPKSLTAAASVTLMNPKLKNHITALLERVSESTREIFSNRFFGGLTCVANALDNVAARRYVDQRCVENQIALFESGTLGPKGHVQVIIPFKTESYGSQNDPVEEGQIPHCTLKLFPEQTLHCVEWARDMFGRKFALQPKALAKFLEKGYNPDSGDIKALSESLKMVTKGPKNFDDCIFYAIVKFYKYFRDDVMQLLYTYPLDAKTKNGEPFWRLPKRPPTPILKFDPEDALHTTFVMSLAVLTAKIYQIPFPANFRSEKERLIAAKQAVSVKIGEFVPSDQQAKAILKESADDKKQDKQKMGEETQEKIEEKIQELSSKNESELYKEILENAGSEFGVKAEQFEKDDDANGHIDFIYAASNLRALNYKLDPMDWITTKLKAGRIVPALVTTTSCVAGLQTLELLKYLKKIQIDQMRNSYINLAVPSIQMSEPGELQKKKLKEGVEVTLWDKWQLHCKEDVTFGEVYERLRKQYGLCPIGVLQGMSRVDFGKGESEKKKFLSSKVLDKLEREEEYLDIVVLFTAAEDDDKILEGVPPVRLLFTKK